MNSSNNIKTTYEASHGTSGSRSSINLFDPVLPGIQPQIEQKSLHASMESNKESLERRLQLRRTIPELVNQGIYPKPNMPLAFAEQCKQLEQAKARDLLQKKLKTRPDRQCLVQHHILEDTHPCVDRSLQDKQRLLKKSKLQDNLNDLISHRPGPLDLLSKNILMLDDEAVAIPDAPDIEEHMFSDSSNGYGTLFSGSLDSMSFSSSFDNMSPNGPADEQLKHHSSGSYDFLSMDENHQLIYQSMSSPEDLYSQPSPEHASVSHAQGEQQHIISRQDIPPAPDITPLLMATAKQQHNISSLSSSVSFGCPSTALALSVQNSFPVVTLASVASTSSAYKQHKTQKKIRTKSISKPKQIKFHEYKGPPSVVKSSQQSSSKNKQIQPEFEMLKLQQEQMMKWQITPKHIHGRPPGMSFIAPKPENCSFDKDQSAILSARGRMLEKLALSDISKNDHEITQKIIQVTSSIPATPCANIVAMKPPESGVATDTMAIRLEDMKVSELRAKCRKLNISCSGSKQQLVEKIQMHRNNSFNLLSTMDQSSQGDIKSELPGYDRHVATCTSVPMMDVETNPSNVVPSSNLSSVYILKSNETNNSALSNFSLASNIGYNSSSNEIKSNAQLEQFFNAFNETKKTDDEKQTLSSDEKIAQLERDLKRMKQEKEELMQLLLMFTSKSGMADPQAIAAALPDQLTSALLKIGLNPGQQKILALDKLFTTQNPQHEVNNLQSTDIVNVLHALSPPVLIQQLSASILEQQLKQANNSQNNNLMRQNVVTKQHLPPQHALFQNQQDRIPPFKEPPSFETHLKNSLNSHTTMNFAPLSQKNSNSFASLVSKDGLCDPSFLACNNQYQEQSLPKVDRNANQRLSQNLNGTSVESMLKLWNMQNQSKLDLVGQQRQPPIQQNLQQIQQQHQQRFQQQIQHQQQQMQQVHMEQPSSSLIDEVLDVLRTKSEFINICTPPLHHSDEMDFFQGISDSVPQGYDISFPFMMESSEELLARDFVGEEMSHDPKMCTPQPDLEFMDVLEGIPGSNNFLSTFDQDMSSGQSMFSQTGSSQGLMNGNVNNQQHQHDLKNGCLLDFDPSSFSLFQPSSCMPFAVKAISKS